MFAMVEAVLVLTHIIQNFRLTQPAPHEIKPWPAITLQPREPINLLLQKL